MKSIAYFSMEVGLRTEIPTYSGGLGVLAGDTLKSAADLGLPMVGVTMLYRKGYFQQHIDGHGQQSESEVLWNVEEFLRPMSETVSVEIEGRPVKVRAWRYEVRGVSGHVVPVYFLDTRIAENTEFDQSLSDFLYGGDEYYRLCQEVVLGCGGVQLLAALGYKDHIETYHMNEGHAALLVLELLRGSTATDVKKRCVFTTHTPVAAGHDRFSDELSRRILGEQAVELLRSCNAFEGDQLNMTYLALHNSRYVNAVAKRHAEVSRKMFPDVKIDAITNGIHAGSWVSPAFAELFDQYVPAWRRDQYFFRNMCECPVDELLKAHEAAKHDLVKLVRERAQVDWYLKTFTIGFARRAATYKRADLLFSDIAKLNLLAKDCGGLQLVFAGKSHPKDAGGKRLIKNIHDARSKLDPEFISLVYIENYDMDTGRILCAGSDLWLNNPVKPMEASGTSGMKAALNGVPSLSTLDGWWVEGHLEGATGWEIKDAENALMSGSEEGQNSAKAAENLYQVLSETVLPLYYSDPRAYGEVMRNCITFNASFFNTQRMVEQYRRLAYRL